MKKFKLVLVGIFLLVINFSYAQVQVNVNLGTPPVWGPTVTTQEYYYLPDINSYYDIRQSQFIYLNNGVWIRANSLPRRYKSYNLKTGYVVVLNDYHGNNPYKYYKNHKIKYYKSNKNWEKAKGKSEHYNNGSTGKGNKKEKR